MKLEDQVTSLELSKKLKELGFKQDSLFYWCSYTQFVEGELVTDWLLESKEDMKRKGLDVGLVCSAFTVAELGELIADSNGEYPRWTTGGWVHDCFVGVTTEADARAKMLIWLKENNYL